MVCLTLSAESGGPPASRQKGVFRNPLITNERIMNPAMESWLLIMSWEARSCCGKLFAVF
jgi:hypothetical protein